MHRSLVFAGMVCLVAASAAVLLRPAKIAQAASANAPVYLANGDIVNPANYREWIYLSSGVDMSYSEKPANMTMFDNVFGGVLKRIGGFWRRAHGRIRR